MVEWENRYFPSCSLTTTGWHIPRCTYKWVSKCTGRWGDWKKMCRLWSWAGKDGAKISNKVVGLTLHFEVCGLWRLSQGNLHVYLCSDSKISHTTMCTCICIHVCMYAHTLVQMLLWGKRSLWRLLRGHFLSGPSSSWISACHAGKEATAGLLKAERDLHSIWNPGSGYGKEAKNPGFASCWHLV